MKVQIEVEIPDGAMLTDWIAVLRYLPTDGEPSNMLIDFDDRLDGTLRIGMLVQASDLMRREEAERWH